MKVLVVVCAVLAVGLAKPSFLGVAYHRPAAYSYSTSVVSVSNPAVLAAPAPLAYAAPIAPAVIPAPAVAPAVVAAPAPVAYAAPAPVAYAAPAPVAYAAPVAPAVVPAPAVVAPGVRTQYHAQNELGQASYGHSEPGQTHNAVQDAYGNKVGSFSYIGAGGNVLRTDYVADAGGYRVASNALPAAAIAAPIDTPEVAAAKANFFSEYAARAAGHARRRRSAVLVQTPASTAPLAYAAPVPAFAPAPLAYNAPVPAFAPAPLAYNAPVPAFAPAPVAYAAPVPAIAPAPLAYAAPVPAPVAYAHAAPVPAVRAATLTTIVNNPGHAVSYRVD